MKKILKFLPMLLIAVVGITLASCSDKDEPIPSSQLPEKATAFITQYFPSAKVVSAQKDKDSYDVTLSDGTDIDFDKTGEWTSVEAPTTKSIPSGFYPAAIDEYVAENLSGVGINGIEKVKRGYEVELITTTEILFGHNGEFIMIGVDR